jgi:protein-disulfide isomerase
MRYYFERLMSLVLTLAAVAMAVTFVHREFFAASSASGPARVAGWTELLESSVLVGDSGAPVKIIEFMDLECPACKTFNESVRAVRRKYPQEVAVAVVHLPLPFHKFARAGARAAECAHGQDRFDQFLNTVYDKQDSIGVKSWASFAADAGVRDLSAFRQCTSASEEVPRIEAGVALARKIQVAATPTVIVNGWRYRSPPSRGELDRVVAAILAGREPFAAPERRPDA